MAPLVHVATCSAPTNIATIKYWGKDSTALNTPLNSSVSVALHQDELRTKTTAAASPHFQKSQLFLNGKEQPLNNRVTTVLREMKALAVQQHGTDGPHAYHVRIVSENSFPTAAGLASSAAGYACLVATLAELYHVNDSFPGQLSTIARQGSGSACRSLYGGFVRWEKGTKSDGSDSKAVQICDEHHWPALRAVICVVNDMEKDTSSTSGMQTSKQTSELLAFRAENIVDKRLSQIEKAYKAKDFETFGTLTMQDSNQFHAVCLDTFPPIFYLNETSRKIIQLVHKYNTFHKQIRAAYTFDAGPNAVLFMEEKHVEEVVHLLEYYFPTSGGDTTKELPIKSSTPVNRLSSSSASAVLRDAIGLSPTPGGVKMLYVTRVGSGPQVLVDESDALVDPVTGAARLVRATPTMAAKCPLAHGQRSATTWALAATLVATVALLTVARRG